MDKSYKSKIKKGIICAFFSFCLASIAFLTLTMCLYVNSAAQLNIGTRETLHHCSNLHFKIEDLSRIHI